MSNVKAERESFYDALLRKILELPQVKAEIEEMQKDEEIEEAHLSNYEIEVNALCNFIVEGGDKDILAIPEIWKLMQEAIRETARELTYNAETFLNEMSSLDASEIYRKTIENIHEELDQALKRKHGRTQP